MKDFLKSAEEQLILNKDKDSIITELSDHVETKREFFESIGYDEEASEEKANEAMGSGEVIGQRLNVIHQSNTKLKIFIIVVICIVNLSLVYYKKSINDDPFILPFLWTLLVFAGNLLFTANAIRLKSTRISAFLIFWSVFPLQIDNYMLAYPISNLIVQNIDKAYKIVDLIHFEITLFFILIIIIPNSVNLYHCKRIRQLKNTKKQNTISRFMRNACVIIAISSIVSSIPLNIINDRICDEQAVTRDELISFTLDTASKFGYDEWDELAEYLENCEYEFEYFITDYQIESSIVSYTYESYRYDNGSWSIMFYRNSEYETQDGYEVRSDANEWYNPSLRYLYTTGERINELIGKIGDPEVGPGNAMGHSIQEIGKTFDKFDLVDIHIIKQYNSSTYSFSWQLPKIYFGCYRGYGFYCDNDDICYYYELY